MINVVVVEVMWVRVVNDLVVDDLRKKGKMSIDRVIACDVGGDQNIPLVSTV